uniref:hypothetical protein n=1 Tax=Prevotella sp. TaxID=59823 RepID=UPI0025EE6CD8|nr:hypothetical protein [Prevotella sp.]
MMPSALGITGWKISWKIGWKISRFGAYLPAFILLMHSEMCRCWNIWQIFSPTRFCRCPKGHYRIKT